MFVLWNLQAMRRKGDLTLRGSGWEGKLILPGTNKNRLSGGAPAQTASSKRTSLLSRYGDDPESTAVSEASVSRRSSSTTHPVPVIDTMDQVDVVLPTSPFRLMQLSGSFRGVVECANVLWCRVLIV